MSRFFSDAEQRCRCGRCTEVLDPSFALWLDELRLLAGRPLRLTSARRCAEHDARVGGKGAHTTGFAADVGAVAGRDKHVLVHSALLLGARGVGVGSTFVHVDKIPEELAGKFPRPALWTYPTRG